MNILNATDAEVLAEAYKLREGYKMKRIMRYRTTRDFSVHNESDAEHIFALIYLANYFLEVEPSLAGLDKAKLYDMLLFHDFGEIKHGDEVSYYKSQAHIDREREAAKEVFESLPEATGPQGYALWQEYESQASPEARFAYALDKTEPLFEILDEVNEKSMHRLKVTYDMHLSNKLKPVENYPVMKRFVEVLSEDMNARGVFWEE